LLGIVVILLVEQRSPIGNPTLQVVLEEILIESRKCQSAIRISLNGALIVALRESRRIM
jgi:hypothetical protein